MDWKKLNKQVIEEFRLNNGVVARFGDLPVVVLNTIGAKSDRLFEVPLLTVIDDGEMYLYGTNAGSKKHPVWIFNVRAHPEIDVEYGTEKFKAHIVELDEQETSARIALQSKRSEQFAEYIASAAPRKIAIFRIVRQ